MLIDGLGLSTFLLNTAILPSDTSRNATVVYFRLEWEVSDRSISWQILGDLSVFGLSPEVESSDELCQTRCNALGQSRLEAPTFPINFLRQRYRCVCGYFGLSP